MIPATFERRVVTKMEAPFAPQTSADFNFCQLSCLSSTRRPKQANIFYFEAGLEVFFCSSPRSKSSQVRSDAASMIAFIIVFKLKSSDTHIQILSLKWLTTLS